MRTYGLGNESRLFIRSFDYFCTVLKWDIYGRLSNLLNLFSDAASIHPSCSSPHHLPAYKTHHIPLYFTKQNSTLALVAPIGELYPTSSYEYLTLHNFFTLRFLTLSLPR